MVQYPINIHDTKEWIIFYLFRCNKLLTISYHSYCIRAKFARWVHLAWRGYEWVNSAGWRCCCGSVMFLRVPCLSVSTVFVLSLMLRVIVILNTSEQCNQWSLTRRANILDTSQNEWHHIREENIKTQWKTLKRFWNSLCWKRNQIRY